MQADSDRQRHGSSAQHAHLNGASKGEANKEPKAIEAKGSSQGRHRSDKEKLDRSRERDHDGQRERDKERRDDKDRDKDRDRQRSDRSERRHRHSRSRSAGPENRQGRSKEFEGGAERRPRSGSRDKHAKVDKGKDKDRHLTSDRHKEGARDRSRSRELGEKQRRKRSRSHSKDKGGHEKQEKKHKNKSKSKHKSKDKERSKSPGKEAAAAGKVEEDVASLGVNGAEDKSPVGGAGAVAMNVVVSADGNDAGQGGALGQQAAAAEAQPSTAADGTAAGLEAIESSSNAAPITSMQGNEGATPTLVAEAVDEALAAAQHTPDADKEEPVEAQPVPTEWGATNGTAGIDAEVAFVASAASTAGDEPGVDPVPATQVAGASTTAKRRKWSDVPASVSSVVGSMSARAGSLPAGSYGQQGAASTMLGGRVASSGYDTSTLGGLLNSAGLDGGLLGLTGLVDPSRLNLLELQAQLEALKQEAAAMVGWSST